jgi:hypothetical protein
LPADAEVEIPERIREDMAAFTTALGTAEDFNPEQFKVEMSKETVIERLKSAYRLE